MNTNKNNETPSETPSVIPVTDVKVFPFAKAVGKMVGRAKVVIGGQFVLTGLRIMDGENWLYVSYPNDPFYKGEDFRAIYYPISREQREVVENAVLDKYKSIVE